MRKSVWLLSAGLAALAVPAQAQVTDTDQGTANPTDGATAEAAAVDNKANEQQPVDVGDIVVTATRRNEALSDVPMAVSAVTAETLRNSGASDIRQLTQLSPSLLVSSTSSEAGAGVARIRGIGTVGDNPGLESSVGVFIDGVYRSRTGVGLTELGAVDRIEVLRGPQGTLFGRNTSAGLISIITAKPRFEPSVYGQLDIGNFDLRRVELGATGPVSDSVALRLDGVYMKRDGFLHDVISGRDLNNRDRWLLRGQVLFQPNDNLSFRLIADYAKRNEECCGAAYLHAHDFTAAGEQPSTIAGIERALGAIISDDTYARDTAITPGRSYRSDVKDGGVSGELVYDFGGAELTSITAYRYNKYTRGQDADFNNLDILYRDDDGSAFNRFKTFTQELRLQGEAFGGKLDWLVGGYYADEKLRVDDNLAYGQDYERFANCILFASVLPSALAPSPNPSSSCINVPVVQGTIAFLNTLPVGDPRRASIPLLGALIANPARPGFGSLAAALGQPLLGLNGIAIDDTWNQGSRNWALFTHNIFSVTDNVKLTVGARYTHERKTLSADLRDNNSLCSLISRSPLALLQSLPCVSPGIPGGVFTGSDHKSESKLSGTAVLSWKPVDSLLTYASYSRGYKAGGYNLDRAALARGGGNGAICMTAVQLGCAATGAANIHDDLTFKPESNDAFELGAKYNGRGIDLNVALFQQEFKNFQLNTFNGLNFIVENINACSEDLGGADTDNSAATGACTGKLKPGVRSRGLEVELFTRIIPEVALNLGGTFVQTKYRDNLVGADGRALTNALFQLPGRRVSNSAGAAVTGSAAWTPRLGSGGLHGLLYADFRYQSKINTGSDLDLEKVQKAFTVVNARIGVRGPDQAWAVELWAQNLFNKNYMQVAFDAPIQGSGTERGVEQGFYARSTQLYGAFLAEPRTYGLTLRAKFGPSRAAPPAYEPPPAPPPPPPATQTCADGSVILATDACPLPPPPPPPPPPEPERG
ncbi:MAG: TonB-dependent receptor [Sphingomicrobium sp.]